MKNKNYLVLITFILILISIFTNVESIFLQSEKTQIIFVDNDAEKSWYDKFHVATIQEGIDNSSEGSTIFVLNGIYYENVIIDKKINLIGENKDSTTIDGMQKSDTVHIKSEKVFITGFTITNSSRINWYDAGIRLNSSNIEIKNNIIKNNMLGVFGKKVENITVYQNSFINDSLTFSLYDKETEPVSFSEKYFNHFVQFNTVNGKPLIYTRNQKNIIIPENAGQVIAVNCQNIKIKNMNLDYADYGCMLINCTNCIVKNTSISNCDGMVWLIHSSENTIQNNNISNNYEGICIDRDSNHNIIQNNLISNNQIFGIIIEEYSHKNTISYNDFVKNNKEKNGNQVYFTQSHGNKWHGNFWDHKRYLPKIIFGHRDFLRFNIPWINVDFRPALQPNT